MTIKEFENFYSYIRKLIKGTEYENHVFFVGGCVRDFLKGDEINDIDVAVDIPRGGIKFAEWLAKTDKSYNLNFNPVVFPRYGTAKVKLTNNNEFKNLTLECVQTRKNASYAVPSTMAVCDNLGSILEDSELRDLTINSMYLDISEGEIFDPHNGGNDIVDNILKTPNNPDVTFKDDPLRMMRIIRFSSKYQWGIEKNTWFGIVKNHEKIKEVSIERFRDELNQILLSNKPSYGLTKLISSGMLYDMIPQLYSLNHIDQGFFHSKNVWGHTLAVVDDTEPILINRLSALFHDIGKIVTKKIIKGQVHFYGHESAGIPIATNILKSLKYPDHVIEKVCCVIRNHMKFSMVQGVYTPSRKVLRKFINDVGDNKDLVLNVIQSDFKNHTINRVVQFLKIKKMLEEVETETDYTNLVLPINGKDVMDKFNIKSGPIIGTILEKVKDAVLETPSLSKEEAFKIAEKHLELIV